MKTGRGMTQPDFKVLNRYNYKETEKDYFGGKKRMVVEMHREDAETRPNQPMSWPDLFSLGD